MRLLNKIIIHHSDSDIPSHQDISIVREWHLAKGWKDVGYHYFIDWNGKIQKGRDVSIVGAHTIGENTDSIGICLGGRDKFTDIQFKALKSLLFDLYKLYGELPIYPHNKYASYKTCPNFNLEDVLGVIKYE